MNNTENDDFPQPADEEGVIHLSNESFAFENTAISESEYYECLDELKTKGWVRELSHSLPLASIVITLPDEYTGQIAASDLPQQLSIGDVGKQHAEEGDDALTIEISSQKLFYEEAELSEFFPGEYTTDTIAATISELDLFPEVTSVTATSTETGEYVADATLDSVVSTSPFGRLMSRFGLSIQSAHFVNGVVEDITLAVNGARVWSRDVYKEFQESKRTDYQNRQLSESTDRELPCGHMASPGLEMVSGLHQRQFEQFDTVAVGATTCYELPVTDADTAVPRVDEDATEVSLPDTGGDGTPMTLEHGFLCSDCGTYYPFVDPKSVRHGAEGVDEVQSERVTVSVGGVEYAFQQIPLEARPIGDRDGWTIRKEL